MNAHERPTTRLWREALARFEVLLQQPPERRERMLSDIGQTQPQLHSMLVSLLESESRADRSGFLDPPRSQNGALGPGTQLGPYRIQSQIGAGGMGEVWLATRGDGLYQGDVAIKTLHPYFGGGALRERFLREAQILGRLTHPNIARLLDAGVSTDGSVYLVLEYVRGAAIDAWSDERRLTVDARLRLFLDVCAAVTQAHANLVVHRDIKPSNILVNGNGQAKLLDFGVAKLLEAEPVARRTELTRMTGRIFTPEYAAPEQVLGEPVTTATDVYALGVLLHVLLTGARPYGHASNPVEIERAVLHDEPGRASLATSPDAQAAAAARSTTPARLRRVLGGDLDNIIARALRKAPGERYASVSALAEDIQRHLAHHPILARPESFAARSRKFVRRHRLGVTATLLVVVAIGVGIGGIVWQAQLARTEARKATAIKDFVVGIFERNSTSHPDGAIARKTTAEDLLSQATNEIRAGLQDAPEVRTELLGLMGRLYANMEMQKDALPLLEEQVASQRRLFGPSHPEVALSLTYLASSQMQSGDYAGAVRSATEAQQIFRARGMESALEYANTYRILGRSNYRLGDRDSLEGIYRAGIALVTRYHPRDPARLAMLGGLADAAQVRGDHEQSLALLQESARLVDTGFIEVDGIERGGVYQRLGDALNWASRNDEAESYMRKAIVEYERAGGPEHPYASDGKRALGMLLAWGGRREEAKSLLQSAFDTQQRVRGDEDPHLTAVIRLDLGRVLLMRGEYLAGEPHLQRVVELWRISGAPTVNTQIQLARLHTEQGRFEVAVKDLEGIEDSVLKVHGAGSWMHATALNRQGDLHLAQGQLREARHFFDRTDQEANDMPGMSPNRAYARAGLLRIALLQRDPRATDLGKDLLTGIESATARADMPDEEAAANMLLGVALMNSGKVQQAQPYLEKAVEMRVRMDAPVSPLLAEARLYLAQQRAMAGAPTDARELIALAAQALGAQQTGPRYQRLLAETRARVVSTI